MFSKMRLFVSVLLFSLAMLVTPMLPLLAQDDAGELQRTVDALRDRIGVGSAAVPIPTGFPHDGGSHEAGGEENSGDDEAAFLRMIRPQSHVKVDGGIPFPKMDEVVLEPIPSPDEDLSKIDFSQFENLELTPEPEYTPPLRCDSSSTKRLPNDMVSDKKEERILADVLYLPEEYVPMDATDVYGSRIKLRPYGTNLNDAVYERMKNDRVPCLPYRMRMSSKALYLDSGLNALKNYDKKPDGHGSFHPWIEKKLFPSK